VVPDGATLYTEIERSALWRTATSALWRRPGGSLGGHAVRDDQPVFSPDGRAHHRVSTDTRPVWFRSAIFPAPAARGVRGRRHRADWSKSGTELLSERAAFFSVPSAGEARWVGQPALLFEGDFNNVRSHPEFRATSRGRATLHVVTSTSGVSRHRASRH
jgi:hypothetical protein